MTPLPSMGWAFRPGGLGMQRDHSLSAPGVTGICDPIKISNQTPSQFET